MSSRICEKKMTVLSLSPEPLAAAAAQNRFE
jgi:hypothetical protein